MPDHLHALAHFPADREIRRVVEGWKHLTAWKTEVVWQRGFFDHRVRNRDSHEEKAAYIRLNPVRAGLVKNPEDWPYIWPSR